MKILTQADLDKFKMHTESCNISDLLVDLSSLNIFDSLKFMVVSSAYLSNKFPDEKLKCKVVCDDIKTMAETFQIQNFEFV